VPRLDDRIFAHALQRALGRTIPVPDLFMTFGNFPLASSLRRTYDRPVVVSSAGGLPSGDVARHVRAVDAIVGDGAELTAFVERFGVTPVEIRKGVDTEHFHPSADTATPVHDAPLRLLWTGRLVPVKNVPMALRVMAELELRSIAAELTLVGAGTGLGSLRALANELGVTGRVHFRGHVDWADLPHAYREADAFVLTSTFDNFPNSVLEAMASGLPIVSTRVGGVPLQVRDGENGFLVPSNDAGAMVDAIERLARDPALRREIGQRNRELVTSSYGWTEPLNRLHALCDTLTTDRAA
jgi:glycosyltransferase involved in cell wall biosynthesis